MLPSRLLAGGLALTALSVIGLGLAPGVAVGVLFMVVFGASYVTVVAIDHSTIQALSDDHIRGRITSLWLMTFGTGFPIGTILMGVIADIVGVRAVLVTAGALVALVLVVLLGAPPLAVHRSGRGRYGSSSTLMAPAPRLTSLGTASPGLAARKPASRRRALPAKDVSSPASAG